MKQHICLICLGSNTNRDTNIPLAKKHLKSYFPTIILGSEQDTPPLLCSNPNYFTNQVGYFSTSMPMEEVKKTFKEIERLAGRLPEDKESGIVKLDIDLLIYDNQLLKGEDLEREYIITGIREIRDVIPKELAIYSVDK